MSEIQQSRYDQLLRRVADLKGPGSKVNDALGELFPMIDVENVPAELLVLSGTRLAAGSMVVSAGGAGNFSHGLLRNAGGTGVIARVVEVTVFTGTGANIHFGLTQNSDTAVGGEFFMDGRVFEEGTAVKLQANNNLLVTGPVAVRKRNDGVVDTVFRPPIACGVLNPGSAFIVTSSTSNLALNISFVWLERQAQPSELNL